MKHALKELLELQALNPQITDDDELIEKFFKESDYIDAPTWSKDDIVSHAEQIDEELTEEQVNEVADLLVHGHDANQGINWDVIASRIWEVTSKV